jgi:SAM-dependent methyltransferase
VSAACGASFPVVNGVPVLLNERRSLFDIAHVLEHRGLHNMVHADEARAGASLKERLLDALPHLSRNRKATENFALMTAKLLELSPRPRVLVIGGGVLGTGMDELAADRRIELVETDVFFGPRVGLICDGTDLPFADATFHGVIIQGVLGNVIDPPRVAAEIHRVLEPRGLVYVEAPFMQQVSLGAYDFTRYTMLGLRRLFRSFEELRSGAQGGPGMTAAWSYQHLLWSFARSHRGRVWLRLFARLTGFWLVSLDRLIIDRPAAMDGASGLFFLGRRAEAELSDRELVALYRGGYT